MVPTTPLDCRLRPGRDIISDGISTAKFTVVKLALLRQFSFRLDNSFVGADVGAVVAVSILVICFVCEEVGMRLDSIGRGFAISYINIGNA